MYGSGRGDENEARQRACHIVHHHECAGGMELEQLSINTPVAINSEVVVEKLAVNQPPSPFALENVFV